MEYQTSRPHPRRRVVRCRANRGRKSCDCCCCCCCPRLSVGLLIRPWLTNPAIRQPVLDFHVTLGWYSNHSGWNPDPKRSCSTSAIEKNKIKSGFSWELNGFPGQGHDDMTHQSLSLFSPLTQFSTSGGNHDDVNDISFGTTVTSIFWALSDGMAEFRIIITPNQLTPG